MGESDVETGRNVMEQIKKYVFNFSFQSNILCSCSRTYVLTTPDLASRFPKLYVPVDFVRINVSASFHFPRE